MSAWEYLVAPGLVASVGPVRILGADAWRLDDAAGAIPVGEANGRASAPGPRDEAVARLRRDGWELIGPGSLADGGHILYFRRPLRTPPYLGGNGAGETDR